MGRLIPLVLTVKGGSVTPRASAVVPGRGEEGNGFEAECLGSLIELRRKGFVDIRFCKPWTDHGVAREN